jgi:hypothetical protein
MHTVLRVLIVCALISQLGLGQIDPWERVRLIEQGKSVSIKLLSGNTVSGKMDEWQADGLVIRKRKDKTVTIPRPDVARVYLNAGMSRGHRAAWAFGIGGGTGAALYGGVAAASGGVDGISTGAFALGGGLFIGGISAAIAALIPQHKELIYQAPAAAPAAKTK